MKASYKINEHLPRLSWLVRISWRTSEIVVEHGSDVETKPRMIFEGAWAGEFGEQRPDLTEIVFGSGVVIFDAKVVLVSSLATTDYIYYRIVSDGLVAANSLALLLAALGDSLDPQYKAYNAINNSILKGIREYAREIPTKKGTVRRLMYFNLECAPDRAVEREKPNPPEFQCFEEYESYLSASYSQLALNARSPDRSRALRIYSTQSKGYDTTAINAIASKHQIDGVFTVTKGKGNPGEPDVDDDGTEIAHLLGLENVMPIERHRYRSSFDDEIYFHASIHENQDANLKQIGEHIHGPALLLTGTLGEMWYTDRCGYSTHPDTLHSGLARWDLGTHGLTEIRLRRGFIQAAIPYIGARRREDIRRITESAEMAHWRLGNSYDRPIPRRLGESAGVPRSMFGQLKVGSVVEWAAPQVPIGADLRSRYLSFLRDERLRPAWMVRFAPCIQKINGAVHTFWWKNYNLIYYPVRLWTRLTSCPEIYPPVLWSDLRGSLFCFAVNECVSEYKKTLESQHFGTSAKALL